MGLVTPTFFCICDEEWCWCSNRVATPEEACPDCRGGKHVMDPVTVPRIGDTSVIAGTSITVRWNGIRWEEA